MPRVPVVPTLSTGLRPLPVVQRPDVNPNPLGQVSGALGQVSGDLFHLAQQEKRRADETRVTEASTTMSALATGQLTSVFGLQGKNAIGAADAALKEFDRQNATTVQGLSPDQRREAAVRIAQDRERLASGGHRHELQERRQYDISTSSNAIGVAQQAAARDPHNMVALGQAEGEIRAQFDRIGKLTGEETSAKSAAQVSGVYATAIGQMLARDELPNAERLFKATEGKLVGDDLTRVQDALSQGQSLVRAQSWFAAAQKKHGTDFAAMRKDAQDGLEGADEKNALVQIDYWDQTTKRDAAERRQRARDYEQDVTKSITANVNNGVDLTPKQWDFARREGMTTQIKRRQQAILNGEDAVTDARRFNIVMDQPRAVLAKVDPSAFVGDFAPKDVERVRDAVRAAKNPTSAEYMLVAEQNRMTRAAAESDGLRPLGVDPAKLTDAQSARWNAFDTRVSELHEIIANAKGRKLTPSEFRTEVLDPIRTNYLRTPVRHWYKPDGDSAVYAPDVPPEARGDFDVPLTSLPPAVRKQYRADLSAMGVPQTDAVMSRYAALLRRRVPLDQIPALLQGVR